MGYVAQSIGQYQSWIPTFTGFSSDPTNVTARYTLNGKMCTCYVNMTAGTSNATTFTMTLPFASLNGANITMALGTDAGTNQYTWIRTRASSNILDIYKTATTVTWTASGNKSALFVLTYEIQ